MEHLKNIRLYEISLVLKYLPPGSKILEIGAGKGWQAKYLAEHQFDVFAIDIHHSDDSVEFDVKRFDGKHIPFPDSYFDVVYSSNVLEHIPEIFTFIEEIKRVLKPNGLMIHLLPTSSWRFWTILTDYLVALKNPFYLLKYPLPIRHGAHGDAISELWLFSHYRWKALFKKSGLSLLNFFKTRLFYTGPLIFNSSLNLDSRKILSYFLGSSCRGYILKKI